MAPAMAHATYFVVGSVDVAPKLKRSVAIVSRIPLIAGAVPNLLKATAVMKPALRRYAVTMYSSAPTMSSSPPVTVVGRMLFGPTASPMRSAAIANSMAEMASDSYFSRIFTPTGMVSHVRFGWLH